MTLPKAFKKYPNIKNLNQLIDYLDIVERARFYAQLFYIDFEISEEDFNVLAKVMAMNYLPYGDKNYVQFNEIYLENEFHYDGISANNKYSVPDYILFKLDIAHKVKGGNFRLLNTVSAIEDLSDDIFNFLKTHKLEFYGFPSFYNPKPAKNELTFTINCIQKIGNELSLRMHIPSENTKMVSVEKDFLHCKIDDFRLKFSGLSGAETDQVFKEIRKSIYTPKNFLEFELSTKMIVLVNNNYIFHGRESTDSLDHRKLKRYQLKK